MWLLTICTYGWIMCSELRYENYDTEDQCYKALHTLYETQGKNEFNYITCSLKITEDSEYE